MSLGSILSIARSAIFAQQAAIHTTAQNVANAETEGYSRQRVSLAAGYPLLTPQGAFGTGVTLAGITRARDELLDASFRGESASQASATLRRDTLSQIEKVFNEPSDSGLAATLDAFWGAWSDLGNTPNNAAAQAAVQQRGVQLARTLNDFARRIDSVRTQTASRLQSDVDTFNALAEQVAKLNKDITAVEVGGSQAGDLRDARDLALDAMSKIANITVVPHSNGRVAVIVGGASVVDEDSAKRLALGGSATSPTITLAGSAAALRNVGGTLEQGVTMLATDFPNAMTQLDALARGLVAAVNELHASGVTTAGDALGNGNTDPLLGPTGSRVNFFDPAGVSAATIRLSSDVLTNSAVIASGTNATGDNSIAIALGSLRDNNGMAALRARMTPAVFDAQVAIPIGSSFGDFYSNLVTGVGTNVAAARRDVTVYETLVQQADVRRQSVSGVSIDEELTSLIAHQNAYKAASKLVTVADEMAQSLLDMVR